MWIRVMACVIHDSIWNEERKKRAFQVRGWTFFFFFYCFLLSKALMDALNLWRRFLWEEAVCRVWLLLCLEDLLQLLGLLTQLLGWGEALPHLGEESCHLVAAQETRSPPFQSMQNACLHRSWVQKQTHGWQTTVCALKYTFHAKVMTLLFVCVCQICNKLATCPGCAPPQPWAHYKQG